MSLKRFIPSLPKILGKKENPIRPQSADGHLENNPSASGPGQRTTTLNDALANAGLELFSRLYEHHGEKVMLAYLVIAVLFAMITYALLHNCGMG